MLFSTARDLALAALIGTPVLLQLATLASAAPDPVIEACLNDGCNATATFLAPCGGGASNSSLQQSFIYTVTPVLGSCECNSQFYNAFSLCLSCIASQGKSSPAIDSQQNWVAQCETYGFNYTDAPINYTAPTSGGPSPSGGGLSKGGVIGISVAVIVVAVAALLGFFFFYKNRRRRTKGTVFERPFTSASGGSYAATPTFTYNNYNNDAYPDGRDPYRDQDQSYYDQQQHQYGSDQNDDSLMMSNLAHSSYIPAPVPMSAGAVAAVGEIASPRPSDAFPQSLRNKNHDWEGRQYEYNSELVSTDHLLHNDKALYDEDEPLEPPRSRELYMSDDYTRRRSVTPPRATYRDEFTRPHFDPDHRRNSGSDRGSVSGLDLARGGGAGYNSNDDEDHENPENAARRRRAAELFSAESSRR